MAKLKKALIGKLLVDSGYITDEQLAEALAIQKRSGKPLGRIFLELGYITENELGQIYALQLGTRFVRISDFNPDKKLINIFPLHLVKNYMVFPLHETEEGVYVAMVNPEDQGILKGLQFFFHKEIKPYVTVESEIEKAIEIYYTKRKNGEKASIVRRPVRNIEYFDKSGIIPYLTNTKSPTMRKLFSDIDKVAKSNATILLLGESGVGKEIIAEIIHRKSKRKNFPFVRVSCAALPETLLESELFGYEKGAFTGAVKRKLGRFELAHRGTLFLDEIGEITLSMQVKLLRVIQTKKITRLGSNVPIDVDVRIIAATNKNLKDAIKNGEFREDLYYRLNVISLTVPPLRERREDIPLFIELFIKYFSKREQKEIVGMTDEAMKLCLDYPWPGNVRELENALERAVVLANGKLIEKEDLPTDILDWERDIAEGNIQKGKLEYLEKKEIERVLQDTNYNITKSARILGIHRNTLRNKIEKLGIIIPSRYREA